MSKPFYQLTRQYVDAYEGGKPYLYRCQWYKLGASNRLGVMGSLQLPASPVCWETGSIWGTPWAWINITVELALPPWDFLLLASPSGCSAQKDAFRHREGGPLGSFSCSVVESVRSQGSCFFFSEPHSEPPNRLSAPPPCAEKRRGASGLRGPPGICLLIWGGEGVSNADPALDQPGVLQEILQTHCPFSSAPLACGQEIKRPGNQHGGRGRRSGLLLLLLLLNVMLGNSYSLPSLPSVPPIVGTPSWPDFPPPPPAP